MNFARLIESLRDLRETSAPSAVKEAEPCTAPMHVGQAVVSPELCFCVVHRFGNEVRLSNAEGAEVSQRSQRTENSETNRHDSARFFLM
jgi:hypothetical protein